ncbi:unnamed protein product [Spirodela intermedia]|uniref:Ubiquinol oxidase n=1 Tax=Spirodela intermedia TaxID=51605 RepID=A0A7I8JJ22_SPIIN|nr:unnamed protein product [Spirodela intermedia]CAA6669543.1 unnamed protein product [Spirodela intermedia]
MGTGFWPRPGGRCVGVAPSTVRSSLPAAAAEEGEKVEANRGQAGEEEGKEKVASYWGVSPPKITKPDGTTWRWRSFMVSHPPPRPSTLGDKLAFWTVKVLRAPTDIFFQRRYGCRAMMLETVAASLRRFEHSGGWIRVLLEEAENERMHLMTFMEVSQPRWYERALVFAVQGVFFNAYFLAYLASPTRQGHHRERPRPRHRHRLLAPPPDATLRDVVLSVRADEAHHRDVNHFASDIHRQGHELRETPAPLGYH